MDALKLKLMRGASYLLPDPGGEVVRECLDEIERLRQQLVKCADAMERNDPGNYRDIFGA